MGGGEVEILGFEGELRSFLTVGVDVGAVEGLGEEEDLGAIAEEIESSCED